MDSKQLANTYRSWLLDEVVPFWEKNGIDREQGGYFTCLERDGARFSDDKYVWLQGRAVWMWSQLYLNVQAKPEWRANAEQGVHFLYEHARRADNRYYFRLNRAGEPVHIQRKIYTEVFAVLAYCAWYAVSKEKRWLDEAQKLFWDIAAWWRNPAVLERPQLAGQMPGSSLAQPMVFLCMMEELEKYCSDARFAPFAQEMLDLVDKHIDRKAKRVHEFVGFDGSHPDTPEGRLLNPGHSIEVAWFLIHHAQAHGRQELIKTGLDILDWSLDYGWDKEFGGLLYFMDSAGHSPCQLEWSMKLWWPHCEALYATALAWTLTKEQKYADWHEKVRAYCDRHFRDQACGEWYGYLDRRGYPTHQLKGGEWKGFFHLPRALLYTWKLLEKA